MIQLSTEKEFINNLAHHAKVLSKKYNLYASVMIAQAIHESGWGLSALSLPPNYNLFGIKGHYKGKSVVMKTWEEVNGSPLWINAEFRKYPSYYESMEDNAKLLRNGLDWNKDYYKGAWKEVASGYRDVTKWLTGRYATDSQYNAKLNKLIVDYNLTQYDTESTVADVKTESKNDYGVFTVLKSFKFTENVLVRDKPSTDGKHIATYNKGETLYNIVALHFKNGYVWAEYNRSGGKGKAYVPLLPIKEIWGSFK